MSEHQPRLVAIDLPGGPAFVTALRRIWDRGDAALPVDQRLPHPARVALLAALRPAAVISGNEPDEQPLAAGMPLEPGDALVVATSGTTGDPKGVVHTHRSIRASAEIISAHLNVDPARDKWYACLPPAHIGGLSVIMRAMLTDTSVTAVDAITADGLREAVATGHTLTSLVVAALPRVDARDWRVILLGGSALPPVVPPTAIRTYGMTETGSGVVYDGYALAGVDLRVDVANHEVQLRTPTLARAYRRADGGPEGVPLPTIDGWFTTGDAGAIDAQGLLSVSGRIGDVIVTGAEKVWPEPVERALAAAPGVADVAVTGTPDATWGHAVTALVVAIDAAAPPTLQQLRETVKATLPAYAAPTRVQFIDAVPRTAIGKIRRAALPALVRDDG